MRTTAMVLMLLVSLSSWAGTFRDDFEDGNLGEWKQIWPDGAMIWNIIDGELECVRMSQWSAGIVTGEASWTDYTIDADVKLLQDHGAGDFDLLARANTNDNGYAFLIGDWVGKPSVYVQRMPDLDMKVTKSFDALDLNTWHHVKLEAEGNNFTFWVNGEKVVEYQDDTYAKGMVGFGVANYTARFDNMVITGPDIPDVMPPTWEGQLVEPRNRLATTWAHIRIR